MELVGRLPELTACNDALSKVRHQATAALIAGPPGIGKTSLWRAVADSWTGEAVVLRTTGISGARAGLANIADLLDPALDAALPFLSAPQASALRTAFGQMSPEAPVTDMLLERAIVAMMRGLAPNGLVIAVDDEQWLDEDSRRLLETAVVRLVSVPVGWLVSVRSDDAIRGLARMLDHELGPRAAWINLVELDDASLSELIMARFPGRWSPGVLRKITTLAAGNPYTALEVARETVACGERDGTTARVPASLAVAVRSRLGRLGQQELATVQAAALTSAPTRALLREVIPGPVDEHIDEALRAGILASPPPDPVLRFSHPLLREAAGAMLTQPQSRELHRVIGQAMDDPHEAAWHLAQGAEEPDEDLAKRLEVAALDAALRGAPAHAASLVRAAVGLTPDQDSQEGWQRRLLWLGLLTAAGEFDQARRNSEDWATRIPASFRGHLSYLRANVETDVEEQYELLAAASDDFGGNSMGVALACAQAAISLGFLLGRMDRARPLAAAAIAQANLTGHPPLVRGVLAADGLLAALAGEPSAGDQLREAVRLPGFDDTIVPYWSPETALGIWHLWRGESDQARELLQAVLTLAERMGRSGDVFSATVILADIEWRAGNWDAAAARARAAFRWGKESSYGRLGPLAFVRSLVKAGYGDAEGARTLAADGLREAEAQRDWIFASLCRWVLGQVELSVDDPAAALRWLAPVADMFDRTGVGDPGCYPFTPDLIEAWAAVGHLDAAADRLAWLREAAGRLDHPWARITSGRAEAVLLLAQRHPALAVDAVAPVIAEARERGLPLELGRCLLVLGIAQRKARQRREAAACLDEAAAVFGRLGAARWRERAQAELARLAPADDDSLTPTEQRIVELATAGHSNGQIAAALFISVKTVEANLTRIYRKLGLGGRVDLTRYSRG